MSKVFTGITPDQCFTPTWLSLEEWGYQRVSTGIRGTYQRGHRLAYKLFCGPLKKGEFVLHSCGNAACVNPYHLRIGTPAENQADAKRHGTTATEFRLPITKLSNKQVLEIRASELRNFELCEIYGVSKSVISNIRSGKTRKNV